MSAPYTKLDTPLDRLAIVCRGCLAESGEMKNIYEWGIYEDFFKITSIIETIRTPGLSELLCSNCEDTLNSCKQFQEQCQLSDRKLRVAMKKKNTPKKFLKNELTCILHEKKLIIKICAPKTESRINLPCPYNCPDSYAKKNDLYCHLKKVHSISSDFEVELQYYCVETGCAYHVNSDKKKWFSGRKFLNQHHNKVHKIKAYFCKECKLSFATDTEYNRHIKTCNFIYVCQLCNIKYNSKETLMVHLLRKHPTVHKMYKNERQAEKRKLNNIEPLPLTESVKKQTLISTEIVETETIVEPWPPHTEGQEKVLELCDSPKKTLSTQMPENITNDVSLPSWQSKADFLTKTDENSTQTVFEDLLSLKSQASEDEMFFSESVSLSDIQTQTFPLEFGLSTSNKETQSCKNSQTQSPDLSIKETQTCFCHNDSPRPNFRLFDSLSSSPAMANLTSTETQTGDHRFSVKTDVLLSFNSAETQTCFDSSNDCI